MPQHRKSDFIEKFNKYSTPLRIRKKYALLSYLTQPIYDDLQDIRVNKFSNPGIVIHWAKVLNKLGFVVDVINWDDKSFVPSKKYDLVVLHGGKNFNNIFPNLKGNPKIIHFLTGSYWRFNNSQEDKRRTEFKKRHGVTVPRDRYIQANEDPVNEVASGIIVLGDPSMKDTYPKEYPMVLTINNASYPDDHFDKTSKDYEIAKNNFLFFAGSGNIHKGLDLLIDSFVDLEQHLYIVTVPDEKVLTVFKKQLKLPNIHLIGQVEMRDKKFYETMDKCAFVILPSCSEGQAGSVVEAMNQGLIPIVSKETRLDTKNFGVILKKNTLTEIRKTVKSLSETDSKTIEKLSILTRKNAIKYHSPKFFQKQLKTAIQTILNQ